MESLEELEQALAAGPDIIMLDDFSRADMRTAVARNARMRAPRSSKPPAASTSTTVRDIAQTGVDFISVGSITKNTRAIDLSMRLEFAR